MPVNPRGIDLRMHKEWTRAIDKQEKLRLTWFRNNEKRLNEIANKSLSREVPEEMKQEVNETMKKTYQNLEKFPKVKTTECDPPIELRTHNRKNVTCLVSTQTHGIYLY